MMPASVASVRSAALALMACVLLGCGSDEASAGGYNALCKLSSDCDAKAGLVCVGAGVTKGICSSACASDGDCVVHGSDTKCVGAGLGNGSCYTECMDSVECPGTHTCYMTATEAYSTCRAAQ